MHPLRATLCAAALSLAACRPRAPRAQDAGSASAPAPAPTGGTERFLPVRAAENSQPRWRYLARGPRPRGHERWRFDLTPREASGEPATDGRTVYVAAARQEPEGPTDGEVFAFDLEDGTLRWHTPVAGLHGAPLELVGDALLVDTIPHCARRGAETPGVTTRPCEEGAPGGVVGLDAITGRQRFRTSVTTETTRARWTAVDGARGAWVHDGLVGLRPLTLPAGAAGARLLTRASVTALTALGGDLVTVTSSSLGATRVTRWSPPAPRARWERALPTSPHCPPLVAGAVVALSGFVVGHASGGPRGMRAADGTDAWEMTATPRRVATCAVSESSVLHQVVDDQVVRVGMLDGRVRSPLPLGHALTSDVAALVDGVLYLGVRGRLVGVDAVSGHTSVTVQTGAESVEGVVLWGGRGVAVTRSPGLVLGFE